VSTHDDPAVVDGADRPGNEDLIAQFAMARARGRALVGPAPDGVFAEPDRLLLIGAFYADLRWARESGAAGWEGHDMPEMASIAYRVLNAARSWRYLETGALGSKVEGASWVRRRNGGAAVDSLLDAALDYQRGGAPEPPPGAAVDAFVDPIEAILRSERRRRGGSG